MRHYLTLPDGRQVHVRVSGEGPAVLVLRDWPHSGGVSAEPLPAVPLGCTVIAPDSPGYGHSPDLGLGDLDEHAGVLAELLDALGVERCVAWGTGLGAVLAVALARRVPRRVASVVVDRVPDTARLRALDPDRLAPEVVPSHSGSHLLDVWHRVRDGFIFEPSYEIRADRRLARAVPDPRTLHRRVTDVLLAPGPWRAGVATALRYDVDAALAALTRPVRAVGDEGLPPDLLEGLPYLSPERVSAGLRHGPRPGGTSRQYVVTRARDVHVRIDGPEDAPPVLLLHPSPGSADTMADVIEDLAQDHLVVGMDLIGNGYSDKSPLADPGVEHYATVAGEALERLALPPVTAFGSHTGAAVALEVAARRPDLVSGLVVEGLPHFTGDEQADVLTRYTPSFEPVHSGAHLVELWHYLRDMHLFWPWYATLGADARPTAPGLTGLHNLALQMLKTGSTYPLAYRAAFRHDPRPALQALRVSGLFVAHPGDMLRESTEVLAAATPTARFASLAPGQGQGPAWAVRGFVSGEL